MVHAVRSPAAAPQLWGGGALGALPALVRDPLGTYEQAMLHHGDLVRMRLGPPGLGRDLYLVFHPEAVRQVLAGGRGTHTKRTPMFTEVARVFGNGLLTSEGELWRRQRRVVAPLFTPRHVDGYATLMAEEATAMVQAWARLPAGSAVALHPAAVRLALHVVGRAIFGRDLDEAVPVLRDAFPPLSRRAFRRGVAPVRIPASWPTPGNRRAAAAQRELFGVVDRLVAQRRAEPARDPAARRSGPPGSPDDLLTVLAAARDPESAAAMTPRQVRDEALVFVLAGHETTAVAITFTLHLLARHPAEQARVATEVRRVLGDRSPTAADLPALVWTTRAVKEALRLYPPAFGTARLLEEAEEVGGHGLPARSLVGVSIWATHRRPGSWPDPARFDPARFAPEQEQSRHRYAYLPFGGGPRACIGAHFALLEAVVATATVVQRLELTTPEGSARPVRPVVDGITLRPPPGLAVRIRPR